MPEVLLSVRPHAMSLKRIFSTMGWINSAKRESKNLEMATKVYLGFRKQSKLGVRFTDLSVENLNALSELSPNSEDLLKDFGDGNENRRTSILSGATYTKELLEGSETRAREAF